MYWFNVKSNETRWNTPPPAAWQKVEVQGHPAKYVNAVTGQETYTVPPVRACTCVRDRSLVTPTMSSLDGHACNRSQGRAASAAQAALHA